MLQGLAFSSSAQTIWDGEGGNNRWTTAANWNNDIAPSDPSASVLQFQGTLRLSPQLNAGWTIAGIQINSTPGANAFTITGNQYLTLQGSGLVNLDDDLFTLSGPDLILAANQTWDASGAGIQLNSGSRLDLDSYQLTLQGASDISILSVVSGSGSLEKQASSTLTLSGNNTFDGAVSVNAGTLLITHRNALGSTAGATTVASGSTLAIQGNLNVAENLTINGAGVGGVGVIQALSGNPTLSGDITMTANSTVSVASGDTLAMTGVVSDMGWYLGLIKEGDGTLSLRGANTFLGPVTVNDGVLNVRNSDGLGSATWGNVVNDGGTLSFQGGITVAEGSFNVAGQGHDAAGAIQNISGANTYSGALTLTGDTTLGSSGGTLTLSGDLSLGYELTVAGSGSISISGNTYGSGGITKTGGGTLTFSGSGSHSHGGVNTIEEGTVALSQSAGANTFNSDFVVGVGGGSAVLRLNANDQLANHLNVAVGENGTFNLNGNNEQITALSLDGGSVTMGAGTLTLTSAAAVTVAANPTTATIAGNLALTAYQPTFDVGDGASAIDLDFSASINAADGFEKDGAGTMSISGSVTTGSDPAADRVRITAGTLLWSASNIVGDSTPIDLNGGTLATGGRNDTVGTLTLSDNSVVNLDGGDSVFEFQASDTMTWVSGKSLVIEGWDGLDTGGGNDQLRFGSPTGLSSGQLAQITFLNPVGFSPGSYGGALLPSGELVPVAVPEPTSVAAALILISTIGWRERRRVGQWLKIQR